MHIAIIGAGITGITSAWYLRRAGHRVTVIERRAEAALETSFANGGQVSLSHPEPWANPGAPLTILRWLGRRDAPLLFRLPAEAARWRWGLEFLAECLPAPTRRNTQAVGNLAAYSGKMLQALRSETQIEYTQLQRGILHLYFTAGELSHGQSQHRILQGLGIGSRMLTPEQCLAYEPSLEHIAGRLKGAMFGDDDESGDAHLFSVRLAALAQAEGVEFRYNTTVDALQHDTTGITQLQLHDEGGAAETFRADAYVICAGSYSQALVKTTGERLPIYPVKGYSATVPVRDTSRAPTASITDESRRIVISRLGDQLRVAGTAELNGYNLELDPVRCAALTQWVEEVFPGAADTRQAEFWAGLRPATPSNVPIIGRARLPNLFYNTGHGTLGWTLSCGSAKLLSDLIDKRTPAIDFPLWRGRS
jgi:D-amino-acid dehydrogenase